MNWLRVSLFCFLAIIVSNVRLIPNIFNIDIGIGFWLILIIFVGATIGNIPRIKSKPTKKLNSVATGCELLTVFLVSSLLDLFVFIIDLVQNSTTMHWYDIVVTILCAVLFETIVFWRGILKIYSESTQLGIKNRLLGIVFAWIPLFNLYYLFKLIKVSNSEVAFETTKIHLNEKRAIQAICKTKYPILLVHGVFFRDFRYIDYWGRVPEELKKNGATIYYGNQQSAASVESCGKELANRINEIVQETGCGMVNIIAHSKGGLDSRAAISHFGAAGLVASLTTINTPHNGCLFAEYLLNKIPSSTVRIVSNTYNKVLHKLGDSNPDFVSAVQDLTNRACIERNQNTPNAPGVLYESVMSYCERATSGKFPLNLSYPLVQHFDGKNDGLVSIDSAKWGSNFILLSPNNMAKARRKASRGISHGDMIDLNRENIAGFDVREFYVQLVASLKNRGF